MAEKHTFKAQARTLKGKKVKQLRAQGLLPGNVINPGKESLMISVPQTPFRRLYAEVGDTGLIYLSIEGEKERPVLVEEVIYHPVTGEAQHLVLRQVNLKEKISASVPVEIIGEVSVPNSVLITVVDEVTVEALPTDLPEKFEVDVSTLTEIGQAITFADLKFDREKVTLDIGEQTEDSPVVLLQEVKEEVIEETPAEAAEGAEGEAAAEGEASEAGESAEAPAESQE